MLGFPPFSCQDQEIQTDKMKHAGLIVTPRSAVVRVTSRFNGTYQSLNLRISLSLTP